MRGYEEKKFNIRFAVWSGIMLVVSMVVLFSLLQEFTWKYWTILGMVFAILVGAYLFARRDVRKLCREMNQVSDIMVQLVEKKGIPEEQYRQGEIGNLYTNLYKLVGTLKESRMKEQEEKLFLRDIMSDISHQLKTPLASLTVFLDLLYDNRVEDETKKRQLLEESKNQVSRMEWMVLSLLKLARIEAGAISFDMRETKLSHIIHQAGESVNYLTEKRGQQVEIICGEEQMLLCDGEWLTEAIINLLKNASDYSPEGTSVTITVEETAVYTRIYIKDQGMGIPEDALPHIFKRFYRVNNEVNPNSVGIGLSLTKSIVEGMGGKITVRSKLKQYTEFILTFVHV